MLENAVNDMIQSDTVRVIDMDGSQIGIMNTSEAIYFAKSKGLDLVEVANTANPPVCRIMDHGKFKYEQTKSARLKSKNDRANRMNIKELRFRPVTGVNDIAVKAKQATKFLESGDRVKAVVEFRGRELEHTEMGSTVLESFLGLIAVDHIVETAPTISERQMFVMISPSGKKK